MEGARASISPPPASLEQVHASVGVPSQASVGRRLAAFCGPAILVAVGYMDPGNWATDLEAGARFGYRLLWVLLVSNAIAVLLQTLAARLGLVSGRDLAQACREAYGPTVRITLWALAEVAIVACDLAEVIGAAIALHLLFGLPLLWGVAITVLDTLALVALQRWGIRTLEALVVVLLGTVGVCCLIDVVLAKPVWRDVASGLAPALPLDAIVIVVGIVGATVMPHNLYLHSALVQTRRVERSAAGLRQALRYNLVDVVLALNAAFLVNAAILVTAAAVFFTRGVAVRDIADAHRLLAPLLGVPLAAVVFAVALLASAQSATLTGTLAGQIVMEGFLGLRLRPALRRLLTRSLAVVPAFVVVALHGSEAALGLLVVSQVVLSLQLPFAVVPLVRFTSDRWRMGTFASSAGVAALAWVAAALVIVLNAVMLVQAVREWIGGGSPILVAGVVVGLSALVVLLGWLALGPLRRPAPAVSDAAPPLGAAPLRGARQAPGPR